MAAIEATRDKGYSTIINTLIIKRSLCKDRFIETCKRKCVTLGFEKFLDLATCINLRCLKLELKREDCCAVEGREGLDLGFARPLLKIAATPRCGFGATIGRFHEIFEAAELRFDAVCLRGYGTLRKARITRLTADERNGEAELGWSSIAGD
jgi:hypothetical protein